MPLHRRFDEILPFPIRQVGLGRLSNPVDFPRCQFHHILVLADKLRDELVITGLNRTPKLDEHVVNTLGSGQTSRLKRAPRAGLAEPALNHRSDAAKDSDTE